MATYIIMSNPTVEEVRTALSSCAYATAKHNPEMHEQELSPVSAIQLCFFLAVRSVSVF